MHIKAQKELPETKLTLDVLRKMNKKIVVMQFENETNFNAEMQKCKGISPIFRDFPIHELLSA